MKRTVILLTSLLGCLLTTAGPAQTIWRCGADGRSFSQTPCADGRAVALPAAPRMGGLHDARARAARDTALASALAAERRQRAALAPAAVGFYTAEADEELSAPARKPAPKPRSRHRPRPPKPFAALGTSPAAAPASRQVPD